MANNKAVGNQLGLSFDCWNSNNEFFRRLRGKIAPLLSQDECQFNENSLSIYVNSSHFQYCSIITANLPWVLIKLNKVSLSAFS